ncbi:hypothetical protein [Ktedonobacter racemifer]|uniref:hypothetical protein n=1 Tax=Ktedonobacter racemifer TaxID=363277 RepID=UPI00059085DF|nr:hypothetical protein [Ktedonobacter racemifer]
MIIEKHYSAYFFDLGGTLLALEQDEIACSETGKVTLLPGVRDHLLPLRGTPVFVITNQAAVALGQLSEATARGFLDQINAVVGQVITENGPESPAFSKAGMNGRSFRAGWVEGKHHSSFVLCSPQDEERSSSSLVSRLRAKLLSVRTPDPVSSSST